MRYIFLATISAVLKIFNFKHEKVVNSHEWLARVISNAVLHPTPRARPMQSAHTIAVGSFFPSHGASISFWCALDQDKRASITSPIVNCTAIQPSSSISASNQEKK